MANPRPCVCGHPESDHDLWRPGCGPCWAMLRYCPGYRKRPRTEPLRARRLAAQLPDTGVRLPGDGRHYNAGAVVPPFTNERAVRP